MADKKNMPNSNVPKPFNPNVSYVIGGKTYDSARLQQHSKQVTTVNSADLAPRQVSKPLENQAGVVQTNSPVATQVNANKPASSVSVNPATPSVNVNSSVKTTVTSTPVSSSLVSPAVTPNVKSGNQINSVIQNNIQTQNANRSSATTVAPQVVNSVKPTPHTVTPASWQSSNGSVQGRHQQSYHSQQNTHYRTTERTTTGSAEAARTYSRAASYVATAAAEAKMYQSLAEMSKYDFLRGTVITAKYTVKTEAVRALDKFKSNSSGTSLVTGAKVVAGKAEHSLASSDDLGTQTAGGAIAAGTLGAKSFSVAQKSPELVVKSVKTVGNGVYQVATTTGLATITVGRTNIALVNRQILPLSKEAIEAFKMQSQISGLTNTRIAQGIINRVESVKTTLGNAKNSVVGVYKSTAKGVKAVYHTVDKSIRIVHGVTTGRLSVDTAKLSAKALAHSKDFMTIKTGIKTGVRTGLSFGVRGAAKGASVTVFRGVPATAKVLKNGTLVAAGAMMASDDLAVQGVGTAITATDIGIKTAVTGFKTGKHTVKTAVKTGKATYKGLKGIYAGVKYIKEFGLKTAWKNYSSKLMMQIAKAGKSIVSAAFAGLKLLLGKFLVPLIVIVAVLVIATTSLSSITSVIGSIFGGTFYTPDTNTEYDIREFLSDTASGVPALSLDYRQDLTQQMSDSKKPVGNFDVVRFYSNTGSSDVVEPTLAGVTSVFPTDEELINMLQAIFNVLLLQEYELEATASEAKSLADELFNGLFRVTTVNTVEYCGQSLVDGDGTSVIHECGSVHALDDCPNAITGTHLTYTCAECCEFYYTCKGHRGNLVCGCEEHHHAMYCYNLICENQSSLHTHTYPCFILVCGKEDHFHTGWQSAGSPGCYSTSYHDGELSSDCGNSTKHFSCNGYKYCNSHSVISYTLTLDGLYALEQKYYTDPIDELANINPRTAEQEKALQELKGNYEIFKEMVSLVAAEYGGGLNASDLDGVNFVNGTRTGNQAVINLAMSQLGQQGGQPYWSYYGFQSRVEWCACFVHWCMRNTSSASAAYPTTSNNAYCPTIANHFKGLGQWGDRNFTNLVAGDTIFFDWEGDGITDHIGIVIGHDGTYVYTVEGNSGDAVRLRQYSIGSSVIYGYGLMNY